ncbi:flagellar hook-basal body complex protein [Blastopirellula sp. J2-11]|uniref:flagellar hook-basal body complex protein n=1 Tax=Blastopirellula sp. J2-11 TaxID=2943192 RepID=UPI0021C8034A|nr:flagellar hook-basal body complex protein [Blastopirellula sp. J2-11]UUO07668.1 flagellar hook-basal body complex protein [Blastopirellula sp. J2-11]
MGLASAMTTALTGMTAAETQIDVLGNNLANSQTVGFKASDALFANQFLQTRGLGSKPSETDGGTNPRQVGLGVMVAEITPNFTQGTIEVSSNPSDLAIQGDGFFIVQGNNGERLYTRNGIFKTNSNNELVTIGGERVLGFGIDENFNIQETQLVPLTIPLGAAAVAKATENVYLEGTLPATGDLATVAQVIESSILGNSAIPRPDVSGASAIVAETPDDSSSTTDSVSTPGIGSVVQGQTEGAGSVPDGTFDYRFTFSDAALANETQASANITVNVADLGDAIADNNTVTFPGAPQSSSYSQVNMYRSNDGGATYFLVSSTAMGAAVEDVAAAPTATQLPAANINGTGSGGLLGGGDVYEYRFAFVDADGNETVASDGQQITVDGAPADGNGYSVVLDNIPTSADYTDVRIYRTAAGGSDFYELDTISMAAAAGPYIDDGTVPLTANELNEDTINGNYSYLVTFGRAGQQESRPSLVLGPQNVINGRIDLTNLPLPAGGTPPYDTVNVYRNLSTDSASYYLVTELGAGESFVDDRSDAAISDLTNSANRRIDLDGPKVDSNTLLVDVVKRDGLNFESMFSEGVLTFKGSKGDRTLNEKSFTVTDTTIVQDLIEFLEASLGIQPSVNGNSNPIPGSENNIADETGDLSQGIYITTEGRIRVVSNNGVDNGIDIGLSSFQLDNGSGVVQNPNLNFGVIQEAVGESAVADVIVYDSLGVPMNVRVTTVLESRNGTNTVYRWFADSPDNDGDTIGDESEAARIAVGTGLIYFDGDGNFIGSDNNTVTINRRNIPSESPLEFDLNFDQLSGLAADKATLNASRQDGSGTGKLNSFIISEDGIIRGVFSSGVDRDLGMIQLARFANPSGLEQRGNNLFASGVNSGLPVQGDAGEEGIGSIIAGAVELSNTDIGGNLIDLILASTQYRGSSRIITTAQQLFDELLNIRR